MTQLGLSRERLERIVTDACLNGTSVEVSEHAGRAGRRFTFRYTGSCESPVPVELYARYSARHGGRVRPIIVNMQVPCRKCGACRLRRELMWRDKAIVEYKRWPMSIFGTLTFRPEIHWQNDARIIARLRAGGTHWSALTAAEQFAERSKELGQLVTNWLKVVRWGRTGSRLRKDRPEFSYLIVCEAHDGERTSDEMRYRPHFHVLFHTHNDGRFLLGSPFQALITGDDGDWISKKYRAGSEWRQGVFIKDMAPMRRAWEHGHTKFQWCHDEKTAYYLTKYLSKTLDARVRASQGYGDPDRDGSPSDTSVASLEPSKVREKDLTPSRNS